MCIVRDICRPPIASTLRHEHLAHVNATENVILSPFGPSRRGYVLTYLRYAILYENLFWCQKAVALFPGQTNFLQVLLYVSNNAFYGISGFRFLEFDSQYAAMNNAILHHSELSGTSWTIYTVNYEIYSYYTNACTSSIWTTCPSSLCFACRFLLFSTVDYWLSTCQ